MHTTNFPVWHFQPLEIDIPAVIAVLFQESLRLPVFLLQIQLEFPKNCSKLHLLLFLLLNFNDKGIRVTSNLSTDDGIMYQSIPAVPIPPWTNHVALDNLEKNKLIPHHRAKGGNPLSLPWGQKKL